MNLIQRKLETDFSQQPFSETYSATELAKRKKEGAQQPEVAIFIEGDDAAFVSVSIVSFLAL